MQKDHKKEIRTAIFCELTLCVRTIELGSEWVTEIFHWDGNGDGNLDFIFSVPSKTSSDAVENHIAVVTATLNFKEYDESHLSYPNKMEYENYLPQILMNEHYDKKKLPDNFNSKYCRALLEGSGIEMRPERDLLEKSLDAVFGLSVSTFAWDKLDTYRYESHPEHFKNKERSYWEEDDELEKLYKIYKKEGILNKVDIEVRPSGSGRHYDIRRIGIILEQEEIKKWKEAEKKKKKSIKKVNGKKTEKKVISKEALKNEAKRKENLKKLKAKNTRKR